MCSLLGHSRRAQRPSKEEAAGVAGDTPLYDLRDFDIVEDFGADCFHLTAEGCSKRKMERMFHNRKSQYSAYVLLMMSGAYESMTVFSEMPRRSRVIKPLTMKGNELTVITLSVFPALAIELMDDSGDREDGFKLVDEW